VPNPAYLAYLADGRHLSNRPLCGRQPQVRSSSTVIPLPRKRLASASRVGISPLAQSCGFDHPQAAGSAHRADFNSPIMDQPVIRMSRNVGR
jgi:hypothetical protein